MKLYFLVLLCLVIQLVTCNRCNNTDVQECTDVLMKFEGPMFALYGNDEQELNDTCQEMNSSLTCLSEFAHQCEDDPECDDMCKDTIRLGVKSGVIDVYHELCATEDFKEQYLEHASCLMATVDEYTLCHNLSETSRTFLKESDDEEKSKIQCCLVSWYRGCYMNATTDSCFEETSLFVDRLLNLFIGKYEDRCRKQRRCFKPPHLEYEFKDTKTDTSTAFGIQEANTYLVIFYLLFYVTFSFL